MASGKNHDRSILFASPIVLAVGGYYWGLEIGIIVGASHFIGGWYLSPDLDLKSLPWKRWGLLKFIWIPYQKFIPHRSPLSHAPVLGSVIRLLYLGACLLPLWLLFPGLQQIQWAIGWGELSAFLIGIELSALNHLLLDGLIVPLPRGIKQRLKGN